MDKNNYDEKVIDAWCSLPLENICSFDEIKEAMSKVKISPRECYKFVERLYETYPVKNKDYYELLKYTRMYLGSFEQIKWERDMAFQQLEDAGMTFGKKMEEESET